MVSTINKQADIAIDLDNNFVFTNDLNNIINIENKLINIFNWNRELQVPVLISLNNESIKKLSYFISGIRSKSCAIGIAGETASGKSTITKKIISEIEAYEKEFDKTQLVTVVKTDDYYYDRSEMVIAAGSFDEFVKNYDLDVPEAFELDLMSEHISKLVRGQEVKLPMYDMSGTAKRYDNHTLALPAKVIVSEGLFNLTDKIKDAFDFKIYVDITRDSQKERWYRRAAKRDLGESADRVYNNAAEKAEIYVKPSKEEADIVINGEASLGDISKFIKKVVDISRDLAKKQEKLELV